MHLLSIENVNILAQAKYNLRLSFFIKNRFMAHDVARVSCSCREPKTLWMWSHAQTEEEEETIFSRGSAGRVIETGSSFAVRSGLVQPLKIARTKRQKKTRAGLESKRFMPTRYVTRPLFDAKLYE